MNETLDRKIKNNKEHEIMVDTPYSNQHMLPSNIETIHNLMNHTILFVYFFLITSLNISSIYYINEHIKSAKEEYHIVKEYESKEKPIIIDKLVIIPKKAFNNEGILFAYEEVKIPENKEEIIIIKGISIGNFVLFGLFMNTLFFGVFIWFYHILKTILQKKFIDAEKHELINLKNEKNFLSNKIIIKITENLHHELKTPMISLRNIILKYDKMLNIMTEAIENKNWDYLQHILKLKKLQAINCTCHYSTRDNFYFNYFEENLYEEQKKLKELADISLKNMYSTMKLTKSIKSLKSKEKVTVYDVVEQSLNMFYMLQKYKFRYTIDEKLKKCILDKMPNEILLNVLINHIQNSLDAKATVIEISKIKDFQEEIEIEKKISSQNYLTLEILDNGTGIPEEVKDNIYNIHFTTKTDVRDIRGTGLYISKQLLEYYTGDDQLFFTSEKGTIFRLIIPIKTCRLLKKEGE